MQYIFWVPSIGEIELLCTCRDYYYYYYYYYYYLLLKSFSHQCLLMVFYWSLSDSKSPQVSRTRLRILTFLSNAVVWIVSTRPPTSKFSRPFNNPLVIVPNAPITIGTIVTLMFHSFFNSLARSRYLSFFSLSFRLLLLLLLLTHWEFFTSSLADGLPMEPEWQ